jgi:DNA-binding transcriptional ArsR family regulator
MNAARRTSRELRRIASRFRVLAEPARLAVLQALRDGAMHVNAIVDATGFMQANLSKHLRVLHAYGMVHRSRTGRFVHYAISDPEVVALCDLMCRPTARTRPAPATISTARRTPARPRGRRRQRQPFTPGAATAAPRRTPAK